jgi:membrane-anchored protein YejM (alkaline phosphatase superfamily)
MYGINSTYWFSFLDENKGSVMFDILKRLDYQINIISSTNTSWPEFRKTCYVNILDSIKDDSKGTPWQKDKQSTDYFLRTIDEHNQTKPIFSFVFLDAPHGHSFPKEFNKFNVKDQNINYLTVDKKGKEIEQLKASYKNAIAYDDFLVGKMIDKLKEKGLYENSLIIFTSDHGEEFYEYGFFGHNSAFSKAQTNSPLILKLPETLKNTLTLPTESLYNFTSHLDIVPTILTLLGVENKSSDYSNGYNIFNEDFKRDFVFNANWNHNAIITKDYTYIFSNLPNKMFDNEVRKTSDYSKVNNQKINPRLLIDIINENKSFLK